MTDKLYKRQYHSTVSKGDTEADTVRSDEKNCKKTDIVLISLLVCKTCYYFIYRMGQKSRPLCL